MTIKYTDLKDFLLSGKEKILVKKTFSISFAGTLTLLNEDIVLLKSFLLKYPNAHFIFSTSEEKVFQTLFEKLKGEEQVCIIHKGKEIHLCE